MEDGINVTLTYVLPSGVNDAPGNCTSDERMNTVKNEPKTDSIIKSIVYSALNEHQISQEFLKPIKVMAAFLVLVVVLLSLYFFISEMDIAKMQCLFIVSTTKAVLYSIIRMDG
ncbi:hypothetical protein A8L50_22650 [Pantoea ananatis]|jgi:hypothetical protein|nr:hypothetical protein [Pantoea ananatis]NQE82120.1 hypothetical protein [Pantoea ananatis]